MAQPSVDTKRLKPIAGVKPPEGDDAEYVTAKQILDRSKCLVDRELGEIEQRLKCTGHDDKKTLMGLALSGGGIRSATFSLGVMQALAKHDVLKKMDYLSTVSGGGYIGSSLSWWLRKGTDVGLGPDNFPFGSDRELDTATDTPAQKRLRHLSQHGKYLTPGKSITLLSGIAVVLRAMLLNLLVWLPVLIVVMMLLVWGSTVLAQLFPNGRPDWMPALLPQALPVWADEAFIFRNLLRSAVLLAVLFTVFCFLYSLRTAAERSSGSSSRRYDWRRRFEKITGYGLAAIGALVVVGSMPAVTELLAVGDGNRDIAGPGAVLAGLGSAIWSFFKAGQKHAGKVPLGVLATLGAAFLVYGLLLTAYAFGAFFYIEHAGTVFWVALAVFAVVASLFGWRANVNYISLHRFYRDRLMETFLPNPCNALNNATAAATDADPVRLSAVNNAGDGRGPFHIVNTNVLLVNSACRRWRIRGGDCFILSPLYCGSNATGWCDTKNFLGDGMTLATAMAISGAAANPNTGVGGVGLTRNPLVSILMALLNLRLGYWAHNPCKPPKWGRRPNHFRPGGYEVGSLINFGGLHEDRPFVQLSDGGHFENLAVYELIRRKLRLIIVCDGGADPDFKFADLQTTLRRIEADFGATVNFRGDHRPATLVPSKDAGYPKGSKRAARGHIVGDISYHDDTSGKLILLKTTMVPGVSTAVKGYKGANPDFPDQTTADQFFDEDQFEAYRELGHHIGQEMVTALDLPQFIDNIEAADGGAVPMP